MFVSSDQAEISDVKVIDPIAKDIPEPSAINVPSFVRCTQKIFKPYLKDDPVKKAN